MTRPSPIPWRVVGVVGHIEIISGSEYGEFSPVARTHSQGDGAPSGSPSHAEATANANLIVACRNRLPEWQDAMMQARDALAAAFRVCAANTTLGDFLLAEIAAAGVLDGFGYRLQDAIEDTRKALSGIES